MAKNDLLGQTLLKSSIFHLQKRDYHQKKANFYQHLILFNLVGLAAKKIVAQLFERWNKLLKSCNFYQHKRMFLSHFLFLFFLTLGPILPRKLAGHSIVEIHGDVFVFNGGSPSPYNSAIYQLSCSSGICNWSTINQELKVARYMTVAIPVPHSFCT